MEQVKQSKKRRSGYRVFNMLTLEQQQEIRNLINYTGQSSENFNMNGKNPHDYDVTSNEEHRNALGLTHRGAEMFIKLRTEGLKLEVPRTGYEPLYEFLVRSLKTALADQQRRVARNEQRKQARAAARSAKSVNA